METKQKLIQSAFQLFSQKGMAFSLTEVAKEVGIKKASIYAHYASKDELIRVVIEEEIKQYFFEINQEDSHLDKIFFSVLAYYSESQTKLLFWKRLLLLPPDAIEPLLIAKIQAMSDHRYTLVKNLITRDMALGLLKTQDPETVALAFFALIHGLLSSVLIYHPQDIKKQYAPIWELFFSSVKK